MDQGAERREYQRLSKKFKVDFRKFQYPLVAQTWTSTVCENISAGGIFIESAHSFDTDDKLQLRIYASKLKKFYPGFFKVFESDLDQSLIAVADIIRIRYLPDKGVYGLALQFTNVYEDDWRALHDLIIKEMG